MNDGKNIKVYFRKERYNDKYSLGVNINGFQSTYLPEMTIEQISNLADQINIFLTEKSQPIISGPIKIGNKVKCKGIGYPHWKDKVFDVTMVFPDNTIGILNCARVDAEDFELI